MRRLRRTRSERGAASVFVVGMSVMLFVCAGLVVDGGLAINARMKVADDAEQASRIGADTLDLLHRASDLVRAGRDVPRRTVARLDEVANRLALVSAEARGVPS